MNTLELQLQIRRGGFFMRCSLHSSARVIALRGPSGAGKTSLLHAIAGLIAPADGFLKCLGETMYDASRGLNVPAHRRAIGYVFQDARLFPHLGVAANLDFGSRYAGKRDGRFGRAEVVEMLALGGLLERRVDNLSGGERQRLAIGRALLTQPRLLLLDEPLSSVDRAHRGELLPYLVTLRDELRLPMVYVSHDPDEISMVAQEVLELGADESARR